MTGPGLSPRVTIPLPPPTEPVCAGCGACDRPVLYVASLAGPGGTLVVRGACSLRCLELAQRVLLRFTRELADRLLPRREAA